MDTKYICVSYVPLLRGAPGTLMDAVHPPPELQEAIDSDAGDTPGCAWVAQDGKAAPILVMKDMDAVLDHLEQWAEGVPQQWFRLIIKQVHERYVVCLMPDLKKSVERFKVAMKIFQGIDITDDASINIIFKPIIFVSSKVPTSYLRIKGSIGDRTHLYCMDLSHSGEMQTMIGLKDEWLRLLGSFKVHSGKTEYDEFIYNYVDKYHKDRP